ncbi:MAG: hypothetical protein AAF399_25945 [Bacteroidota bacterium]
MKLLRFSLLLILLPLVAGCEGFFGRKTSTDFLAEPVFDTRTVAYVPIQPVWDDLDRPVDIIAGWDELIYVADGGREEIIAFDQAGGELGRFPIPGLQAIAQDRRLDILAAGVRDTIINGREFVLPAIYRLSLDKTGDYGLNNATITRIITHPFYFKSGTPTGSDSLASFTGIAPLANNWYYLSRNGLSNSANQFGGPDDAVLLFNDQDEYISPVAVSTNLGLFRDYFIKPSSIATFAQPPQSPAINDRGDFLFTSVGENNLLKVQLIRFQESDFGSSYLVENLPVGDTSKAEGFLYEPNRFTRPMDVSIAGDATNYFFVVDAEADSLYQFNRLGYEGANPPPGANTTKTLKVSFGGTGNGLTQFREPMGVAYLDQIVYVADAGNGRILRFRLTTDFE